MKHIIHGEPGPEKSPGEQEAMPEIVGVHPHMALSATRGKVFPFLVQINFSHVLWQLLISAMFYGSY